MNSRALVLITAIAAIVIAMTSIGYAITYTAVTTSASSTVTSTYITLNLTDSETDSTIDGFTFNSIKYYRDKTVTTSGCDESYKSYETRSDLVKVKIEGNDGNSDYITSLAVRLSSAVSNSSIVISFFYDEDCENALGSPITLSTSDQGINDIVSMGETYYCYVTVTLSTSSIAETPSGSVSFDIIFTATASTV